MPGILEKRMKERKKVISPEKKKSAKEYLEDLNLPQYSDDGDIKRVGIRTSKNWLIIIGAILALVAIIYVPSFFYKPASNGEELKINLKQNAIAEYNNYLKEHPDYDFDEDGISNGQEIKNGTDPRNIDSDNDGISDFVELYVSGTNPLAADSWLVKYSKSAAEEAGKSVNSPYKVNDVVMWPKDWESRAKGSVVKTLNGYRFCDFTGWAQFPMDYKAYKIKDGIHVALEYLSEEKAYKITDDCEIVLSPDELDTAYQFSFFGKTSIIKSSFFGKIFNFLLPNNSGFIACKKIASIDVDPIEPTETKIDILKLDYLNLPDARYGKNMNKLTNLASVYNSIKNGKCVLMSIYIEGEGEVILEVYGYDSEGSLLVADPGSQTSIGKFKVEERVKRVMIGENTMQSIEWFNIKGFGIDSSKQSVKIYFFG